MRTNHVWTVEDGRNMARHWGFVVTRWQATIPSRPHTRLPEQRFAA